jgi:hypothetical protein
LGLLFLTPRHESTLVVGHHILGLLYGGAVRYSTKTLSHRGAARRSLGGIGNTSPSSSDSIPMGSKRFAPQPGHRVRVSLANFVFRRILRQIGLR